MPDSPRALIFDLDGTLLDSLVDLANAGNQALASLGFPGHPAEAYRLFIGDGVLTLFERALPEEHRNEAVVGRCIAAFGEAYSQGWNIHSRPYEGIPELLDAVTERGFALCVLSNKPDPFTKACVSHYFSRWPFGIVRGQLPEVPRKPDPAGALRIAAELGIGTERFVYLGDSAVDMTTARRAGMKAIGASWGFRDTAELHAAGAEAVIDHPGELLALLNHH